MNQKYRSPNTQSAEAMKILHWALHSQWTVSLQLLVISVSCQISLSKYSFLTYLYF